MPAAPELDLRDLPDVILVARARAAPRAPHARELQRTPAGGGGDPGMRVAYGVCNGTVFFTSRTSATSVDPLELDAHY